MVADRPEAEPKFILFPGSVLSLLPSAPHLWYRCRHSLLLLQRCTLLLLSKLERKAKPGLYDDYATPTFVATISRCRYSAT